MGALSATVLFQALQAQSQAPLVQAADLQYQGAFRVPTAGSGGSRFETGGGALTFNSVRNTLLAMGYPTDQQVAEITIPTPSTAGSLSSLPVATYRYNFTDVLEGKRETTSSSPNGDLIGGLLVSGNALIVSAYAFYDGNYEAVNSHFRSGLDFSTAGDVQGPYRVGSAGAGSVGGYMTLLPTEWQSILGGTALTGQCCLPILGRTSSGPAVSAFNPANVGSVSPVPATQLLGYDVDHKPGVAIFKGATLVTGVVAPPGTRSVLFFGRHGLGADCYGDGAPCGDPTDPYKGYHAYPYVYQVWAYDINDLVAVKNGTKAPWEPRPYAMWTLDLPFSAAGHKIQGAGFDPATSRIYLTAESDSDSSRPVVHVFKVTGGSAVPTPTSPSNLRIVP